MKLDAVDFPFAVFNGHHLAVIGNGCHREVSRNRFRVDCKRVVSGPFEGFPEPFKERRFFDDFYV